jgi:hypothetical protein
MSNPSGDSTISGLPAAQTFTGTEQFVVDQNQGGTLTTVKVSSATLANQLNSLPGTVQQVANGGTGNSTLAAHAVLIGEGASAVATAAPGAAGNILGSNGAGADPSFQTKAALGLAASGANSDITSLSGLTTALSVAQGGTGRQTLTAHGVLLGEGTTAINQTTAGTSGQALISGGASADPAFGTLGPNGGGTGLTTITAHGVMVGEGTSNVATVGPNATIGLALISQGVSADPIFGNPTGALINVQRFTSSTTYTPTAGANSAIIFGCGAGGGGGGVASTGSAQAAAAGMGAAGSWGVARITSLSSQTVTIGAAGTGGAAGANAGVGGGQTSIGTWLVAPGGGGGSAGPATAYANLTIAGTPGAPGSAPTSSGTLLYSGQGDPGTVPFWSYNGGIFVPGKGGSGPFGSGGYNPALSGAGVAASGNGAGGGGASQGVNSSAAAGGNATAGLVLIYEYA